MDWETFYERFYDWAESAQISRIFSLQSYGPSDEIAEVLQNISNEAAASHLAQKALYFGIHFTAQEICQVKEFVDRQTLQEMAMTAKTSFTAAQVAELVDWVDDDAYEVICLDGDIPAPAVKRKLQTGTKGGFGWLSALFAGSKKKHNGKCNGD